MLNFPAGLRPIGGGFAPFAKTNSGGQSLSGFEQVVDSLSDRWTAGFSFKISTSADLLRIRAFILSMRGRANTVALPGFDNSRAPWAVVNGIAQKPSVMRTRSLDGTAYADAANFNDSLITAFLGGAYPAMATQISISMAKGSAPLPGHLFGLGTRLYSILDVTGSNPYLCDIWPSLRVDATTPFVNFTSPVCEMRFATDNEGADALKGLSQLRLGTVTLNFEEAAVTS
jgi:hypothetical protein